MILINKDLYVQNLVLTLTESTTVSNPIYLLVLQGDFTKTQQRFILESNLSTNLNRYDLFQLFTTELKDLETGLYSYQVYQSRSATFDETLLGVPIETGKATVIAPADKVSPITYSSDSSEYVIYKSDND